MSDHIEWLNGTKKGYLEAYEGDGIVMERPWIARGTVQKQTSPTITTNRGGGSGVVVKAPEGCEMYDDVCIRYLTEGECLRLMGQSEEAIEIIKATEPAKTRIYEMAGNSIVVDVLVDIFKGIYVDRTFGKREKRPSLEDFL